MDHNSQNVYKACKQMKTLFRIDEGFKLARLYLISAGLYVEKSRKAL